MTADLIARARAAITKADAEVIALCQGKRWIMQIPARPDADSDLVIADALALAERLADALEAAETDLHAAIDTARERGEALKRVAALHRTGEWSCANPQHTNPSATCPDCAVYCVVCDTLDYPCQTVDVLQQYGIDVAAAIDRRRSWKRHTDARRTGRE